MTAQIITVELLAGAVIVWQAICHLNRMTQDTNAVLSIAWVVLGAASAAAVAGILAGCSTPDIYSAGAMAGMAMLLMLERRRS